MLLHTMLNRHIDRELLIGLPRSKHEEEIEEHGIWKSDGDASRWRKERFIR